MRGSQFTALILSGFALVWHVVTDLSTLENALPVVETNSA